MRLLLGWQRLIDACLGLGFTSCHPKAGASHTRMEHAHIYDAAGGATAKCVHTCIMHACMHAAVPPISICALYYWHCDVEQQCVVAMHVVAQVWAAPSVQAWAHRHSRKLQLERAVHAQLPALCAYWRACVGCGRGCEQRWEWWGRTWEAAGCSSASSSPCAAPSSLGCLKLWPPSSLPEVATDGMQAVLHRPIQKE
jgi:hypothetical protein